MADAPSNEEVSKQPKEKVKPELPHCGVIMPISGSADYPASHWADMLLLIREAAKAAKFTCEIVSATGRDDIIHTSIVTNIYQNEIVICDVSSRNPNVMLELGLRLASKLPVIIIFDGQGSYPFDIGTIRYMPYPRDMRYYETQKFKEDLTDKILEVYDTHKKGEYKSFLSHFKNVNFDLDSVGSETQTLKDFMERIDGRLSSLERRKELSPVDNEIFIPSDSPDAYRNVRPSRTIAALMKEYISSQKIARVTPRNLIEITNYLSSTLPSIDFTPARMRSAILNEYKSIVEPGSEPPF
jgi:hypothetical protein